MAYIINPLLSSRLDNAGSTVDFTAGYGTFDSRYLKLDASNDPLTGALSTSISTAAATVLMGNHTNQGGTLDLNHKYSVAFGEDRWEWKITPYGQQYFTDPVYFRVGYYVNLPAVWLSGMGIYFEDIGTSVTQPTTGNTGLRFAGTDNILFEHPSGSGTAIWYNYNTGLLGKIALNVRNFFTFKESEGCTFIQPYTTVPAVIVKQLSSGTANLQEWQNSSSTVLNAVASDGKVGIGIGTPTADAHIHSSGSGVVIKFTTAGTGSTSTDGTDIGLSNTRDFIFTQRETAGDIRFLTAGSTRMKIASGTDGGMITLGENTVATAQVDIISQSSSRIGLIIKGAASQSSNLQNWQNSSGTTLTSITSAGAIYTNINSTTALLVEQDGVKDNVLAVDTTNGYVGIGTGTPSSKLEIVAGTLVDQKRALAISATMPGGTVSSYNAAMDMQITSANQTSNVYCFNLDLKSGATDARLYAAGRWACSVAGTGTGSLADPTLAGNSGVLAFCTPTTVGYNFGGRFRASNGLINVAVNAISITAKDSSSNIGVFALANNTGASPIQIGGWFGLGNVNATSHSAALIAENGTQTSPIFLGRDNGTIVFSIADGGTTTVGSGTLATAQMDVITQSASRVGLIVKAAASQSANLQEWHNSSGTVQGSFLSATTPEFNVIGASSRLGLFQTYNTDGFTIRQESGVFGIYAHDSSSTGTQIVRAPKGTRSFAFGNSATTGSVLNSVAVGRLATTSANNTLAAGPYSGVSAAGSVQLGIGNFTDEVTIPNAIAGTVNLQVYEFASPSSVSNYFRLSAGGRNASSDGYGIGLTFEPKTSTTVMTVSSTIKSWWVTATHASRTAALGLYVNDSAGEYELLRGVPTEVVVNENAEDRDFRVETDSAYNSFFSDAGNDAAHVMNHASGKLSFFAVTAVTRQTELTDELTTITFTAPGTPDYAIQDLTAVGGFGFVTKDEGNTVLSVVANLQARVNELETKLTAYGLLQDAD